MRYTPIEPNASEAPYLGVVLDGKLRLDAVIGRGGMGVVYAAHHLRLDRPIAVKILGAAAARNVVAARRFLAEAQAASKIDHPNVVAVLDMGETSEGVPYIALELLYGETLADVLMRRGVITIREAADWCCPIMRALGAAHALGILHRDVKPENIFLSRDARDVIVPKLLDFGIAKLLDRKGLTAMTRSGVAIGTPRYMSPEQASARAELTPASDVWSMGVVVYEALSGAMPFDAHNDAELFAELLTAPAIALASRCPGVPASLAQVVDRALKRAPEERFSSILAMATAFEDAVSEVEPQDTARPLVSAEEAKDRRATEAAATDAEQAATVAHDATPQITTAGGRGGRRWVAAVSIAGALLASALVGGYWFHRPAERASTRSAWRAEVPELTRLTAAPRGDVIVDFAVAPDGQAVATIDASGGHIARADARTQQAIDVPPAVQVLSLSWTTGEQLALVLSDGAQQTLAFYDRASHRLRPQRPLRRARDIALSADGRRLSYLRDGKILVGDVEGAGRDVDVTPPGYASVGRAPWSPDQTHIAAILLRRSPTLSVRLCVLRPSGGVVACRDAPALHGPDDEAGVAWLSDTTLAVSHTPDATLGGGVARMRLEAGSLSAPTAWLPARESGAFSKLVASVDGRVLLVERIDYQSDIVRASTTSPLDLRKLRVVVGTEISEWPSAVGQDGTLYFTGEIPNGFAAYARSEDGSTRAVGPTDTSVTRPEPTAGGGALAWQISPTGAGRSSALFRIGAGHVSTILRVAESAPLQSLPPPYTWQVRCFDDAERGCLLGHETPNGTALEHIDPVTGAREAFARAPTIEGARWDLSANGRVLAFAARDSEFCVFLDLATGARTTASWPASYRPQQLALASTGEWLISTGFGAALPGYAVVRVGPGQEPVTLLDRSETWFHSPALTPDDRDVYLGRTEYDNDVWRARISP